MAKSRQGHVTERNMFIGWNVIRWDHEMFFISSFLSPVGSMCWLL